MKINTKTLHHLTNEDTKPLTEIELNIVIDSVRRFLYDETITAAETDLLNDYDLLED